MPDNNQQGKDRVLQATKDHDIKFISLWFTDVIEFLKGFTITVEELEAALEDGMGFDSSSIEGFAHMARHAIHTACSALCWQPAWKASRTSTNDDPRQRKTCMN
jgi:glutamine synthetase